MYDAAFKCYGNLNKHNLNIVISVRILRVYVDNMANPRFFARPLEDSIVNDDEILT